MAETVQEGVPIYDYTDPNNYGTQISTKEVADGIKSGEIVGCDLAAGKTCKDDIHCGVLVNLDGDKMVVYH